MFEVSYNVILTQWNKLLLPSQTPRIFHSLVGKVPWTSKWAAPRTMEAPRFCFQAAQAPIKAESLFSLQGHAALPFLHQTLWGWKSYTRLCQGRHSLQVLLVLHAVPGSWLPFLKRLQTPGESEHMGGQGSSGRAQNPMDGPFSVLPETSLPREKWGCHCKPEFSTRGAAKHSTVHTGSLGLGHCLCEALPRLESPNATRDLAKDRGAGQSLFPQE